jgi:hypothetical protein
MPCVSKSNIRDLGVAPREQGCRQLLALASSSTRLILSALRPIRGCKNNGIPMVYLRRPQRRQHVPRSNTSTRITETTTTSTKCIRSELRICSANTLLTMTIVDTIDVCGGGRTSSVWPGRCPVCPIRPYEAGVMLAQS